ncbi:DMT family transporter [Micrococcus sp. 116]|uniref:EamA family transporter n=1 Tax=Micrococcus sp. 116 TaxID=2653154 RepID=UPI0012F31B63|nr:EamA family transporter [Micrococcus sp. 116]VWX49708.1 Inner membrane transporter RhtA [Micrococcus sp. 116]
MRLVLLVLLSLLSQQLGASVAGLLFDDVGASAMVALRVVFSAAVLLLVTRPSRAALAGLGPRGWAAVVGLGAAMTGMNLAIYEAFARIPQGVAVTFEVLGPLALSVAARPSWRSAAWAALALAGIGVLGREGFSAGGGMACWAGYILLSRRAGTHLPGVQGLALATAAGSLVALPVGVATAGAALLSPVVLGVGLAVALLSTAVPYGIDLQVLRRMPTALFSLLTCLSPIAAALTAWAVRGQELTPLDLAGMLLVIAACAAAVWTSRSPGVAGGGRG